MKKTLSYTEQRVSVLDIDCNHLILSPVVIFVPTIVAQFVLNCLICELFHCMRWMKIIDLSFQSHYGSRR